MLQVVSALKGYAIQAEDGLLGTVVDFLFDDRTWNVRWLVVEAGTWLTGRRVLVHPSAIGPADDGRRELAVVLTKAQVKDSPGILGDRPVSQQMQDEVHDYYGWDPLWGGVTSGAELYGSALFGAGIAPLPHPRRRRPRTSLMVRCARRSAPCMIATLVTPTCAALPR